MRVLTRALKRNVTAYLNALHTVTTSSSAFKQALVLELSPYALCDACEAFASRAHPEHLRALYLLWQVEVPYVFHVPSVSIIFDCVKTLFTMLFTTNDRTAIDAVMLWLSCKLSKSNQEELLRCVESSLFSTVYWKDCLDVEPPIQAMSRGWARLGMCNEEAFIQALVRRCKRKYLGVDPFFNFEDVFFQESTFNGRFCIALFEDALHWNSPHLHDSHDSQELIQNQMLPSLNCFPRIAPEHATHFVTLFLQLAGLFKRTTLQKVCCWVRLLPRYDVHAAIVNARNSSIRPLMRIPTQVRDLLEERVENEESKESEEIRTLLASVCVANIHYDYDYDFDYNF